ncbi:MAG: class I SAM-dependent DNA methyltransferase [Oscillospiraceae bacterium]|nr:class I SAM-dependent DNA methyltransferase [Oscillospiraceae bacterium]
MTDTERRLAAQQFVKDWTGHGDEKQETQRFWMGLLQKVYGVAEPDKFIEFEKRVVLGHTSFIDGYIRDTSVLIEQKGADIDLRKGYRQSDGSMLTPYQQARRYAGNLPHDMNPRWIVVCNFKEFHIHDMNRPNDPAEVVLLEDLPKEYHRLQFLVDTGSEHIRKEMRISLQAGELVGKLYDALLKQYTSPASEEELKSLNMLCVRLVFCLYAEDAGVFGGHDKFRNYLKSFQPKNVRSGLIKLFEVLDTKETDRDPYMDDDLAAFPYVNGGLFADKNIIVPKFTDEIITLLVEDCGGDFNWSEISPTIFGAVFESTLNPETRRAGGMHYTSIENIHKVIDPLFYNQLCQELEEIAAIGVEKTRKLRLEQYQAALAKLKFLDPACGSGNFLTETYISLRRLENRVIAMLGSIGKGAMEGQIVMGEGDINPIKVSIGQFYGIEINDFAVTVAKTALWIAESQMMKATEELVHMNLDFLPLKSYAHIVEGNALQLDWETVVPKNELNYIMGNPPFVGAMWSKGSQREDIELAFPECSKTGQIDYVAGWYAKAAKLIVNTNIRCAFVSTNSICQGQQVGLIWEPLINLYEIKFDFAYQTFRWDSEANLKAQVHCVIIGFSHISVITEKKIYTGNRVNIVHHINGYLAPADDVFIMGSKAQISGMPTMHMGVMARDGGNLIMDEAEYQEYIEKEPQGVEFIHPYMMGREFLNNIPRYCFWLVGANPAIIKKCPLLLKRIEGVRQARLSSPAKETQKLSETPTLFAQLNQPKGSFIAFPKVSSERRKYIPIGFLSEEVIVGDKLYVVEDVGLYHFGILTSNVHNAWMRLVAGRMKSDYSYSNTIVYNSFPWPTPTDAQRAKIEKTAQAILDARALYPDCSLADLYDEVTMPPELRKAHQQNDRAVMEAYGFWGKLNSEPECVAELMKMYQALTT